MDYLEILLNSIEKVNRFVSQISCIDAKVYLISQNHKIDAKSILAILSTDITKPFKVVVESGDYDRVYHFIQANYYK